MSNPQYFELDGSLALNRIRGHARIIKGLIESEFKNDLMNVRIWRALYFCNDRMVAASIHQQKGQALFAQVQQQFAVDAYQPAQVISGNALTVEEMAVFLGLEHVSLDDILWVEQAFDTKGLAIVKQVMDGVRTR